MMEKENEELEKMYMQSLKGFDIYINTNDAEKLDAELSELNNLRITQGKQQLYITNLYDAKNSLELEEISKQILVKIPIYVFACMIAIFSILNIFNTISNSIILRKREIAELKSIGMSNSQIRKMLFLESIFYGADGLIYGILISIIILYPMYLTMVNTKMYAFNISWLSIIEIILITYAVIFVAMNNAKNKIKSRNIIEEIKEENI